MASPFQVQCAPLPSAQQHFCLSGVLGMRVDPANGTNQYTASTWVTAAAATRAIKSPVAVVLLGSGFAWKNMFLLLRVVIMENTVQTSIRGFRGRIGELWGISCSELNCGNFGRVALVLWSAIRVVPWSRRPQQGGGEAHAVVLRTVLLSFAGRIHTK